jgi:hypothetical protein
MLARNESELREGWKNYRTHTKKNLMWILEDLAKSGARHIEDLRPIFDETNDHGELLDTIKQIAFYSDSYDEGNWSNPIDVVNESLATSLVRTATTFAKDCEKAMTTEAELELWMKHLRPVWKGSMADMKRALLACYAEAESLGVLQGRHTTSDMTKFVL